MQSNIKHRWSVYIYLFQHTTYRYIHLYYLFMICCCISPFSFLCIFRTYSPKRCFWRCFLLIHQPAATVRLGGFFLGTRGLMFLLSGGVMSIWNDMTHRRKNGVPENTRIWNDVVNNFCCWYGCIKFSFEKKISLLDMLDPSTQVPMC